MPTRRAYTATAIYSAHGSAGARVKLYARLGRGRSWSRVGRSESFLFFSFLSSHDRVTIDLCRVTVHSFLSSVEHGTFFGRFLCHSCHIRHRIRDPGYHRRGGGNRAWDSKRSDAGRDARRGRAMGAWLWWHAPLAVADRGWAVPRAASFELGVQVDHALHDGEVEDRRGSKWDRPSWAAAARRGPSPFGAASRPTRSFSGYTFRSFRAVNMFQHMFQHLVGQWSTSNINI